MYIILMLLLISLLIIVHELGHFLAAKAFGVQVSRFALGMPFGPTLFRKKFGETEFLIHAFFMGGYVSFPDDIEAEGAEGETEESLPADSPKRFKNKAPWQQAVIIASGVAANVLFALFLVFATALYYQKLPSGEVAIEEILPTASETVREKIKPEDTIISVNGVKIDSSIRLTSTIQKSKSPLEITVLRNGEKVELEGIYTNEAGFLGVSLKPKETFIETKSVKTAAIASFKYTYDNTRLMLFLFGKIATGKIPAKDLHGILLITTIGGDIIKNHGLFNGLLLTAMISINLAVINLLPIPAVDGGHLMFLFLEKIRGRKFDEKTLEKINSVFFMLLLVLMVLIFFNDIIALVTKKFIIR